MIRSHWSPPEPVNADGVADNGMTNDASTRVVNGQPRRGRPS